MLAIRMFSRLNYLCVSFIFIVLSCYNHQETEKNKPKINTYNIQDVISKLEQNYDYTMSFDGKYFFAYDGKKLIKYNLETSKTTISKLYSLEGEYNFNLINSKNTIGILMYNKKFQYDATQNKKIRFYEINPSLELVDSMTFKTKKMYHVLDEDFDYTSYYEDKDTYYFNHAMSYLKVTSNNNWPLEDRAYTNIDLTLGVIYKAILEKDSNKFLRIKNEDGNFIDFKNKNTRPYHLSIVDNSIIFYSSKELVYINDNKVKTTYQKLNINPSNRIKNGVYGVDENLKTLNVFSFTKS